MKHLVGRSHFIEDEDPSVKEFSADEMIILKRAYSPDNPIKLDNDRVAERLNMHDKDCIDFFNERIKVTKDEAYLIDKKTRTQSNLCWRSSRQVKCAQYYFELLFFF